LRIGYFESSERSESLKAPITSDTNRATPPMASPTDHPHPSGRAAAGILMDGTEVETLRHTDAYQLALGPIQTSATMSARRAKP
jgi:hypothetical protein